MLVPIYDQSRRIGLQPTTVESEDLMSDTNKILDVTYGTFSCRLEGFEDSVETMKTVVTFFHELAGHDRFMDVAPQAPDLDTLAELTGREAGVRVDAETDDNGLVLRARAPEEDSRPSLRIQRPEKEQHSEEIVSRSIFTDDDAEPEDATDTSAHFDTLADPSGMDEGFADDFVQEETTEDTTAAFEDDETDADSSAELSDAAPQDVQATTDSTESVADKLQRIRAVVGRTEAPRTDDSFAEDLTEQNETATSAPANPLAQRLAELAQRNAAVPASDTTEDTVEEYDAFFHDVAAHDEEPDDDDLPTEEEKAEFAAHDNDETPDAADETQEVAHQPDDVAENSEAVEIKEDSDDDADLHEQVAEVERMIALRRENRSKWDELPRNVDAAMSRILSQADEHLNEPEGRRHRDTIAQLKAAVAATQAARRLGDSGNGKRELGDAFREDLDAHEAEEEAEAEAQTEEAQDTVEAETTEPAPAASLAPLRLVAEQRVDDTPKAADSPADRLRRIAAQKDTPQDKTGGFAEFAAQQGATELGDLLEAAAAYIAFVEGDDDFSRPQVMRKVQMATADEFSREDGLRSFGRLLRQSRIIKLDNGRFQVSEDTKFRPDDQAAQG